MDWASFFDNVWVYAFWIALGYGVSWLIRKYSG
jgi:hypothetical protein